MNFIYVNVIQRNINRGICHGLSEKGTMAEKIGILFLHHNHNRVTLNNLASIRRNNAEASLITICDGKALDDGLSLDDTPEIKDQRVQLSRSSDLLVCSWFLQKKFRCDKWWIVEWDVFCEVSVREYYQKVWDYPFVASSVRLSYREPKWAWFKKSKDMPDEYKPYVMGTVPFLYLMSEPAIESTCKMLIKRPIRGGNGELRFTTAAHRCGFVPCGFSPPNDKITWRKWNRISGPRTIFHPVKHYVDYR